MFSSSIYNRATVGNDLSVTRKRIVSAAFGPNNTTLHYTRKKQNWCGQSRGGKYFSVVTESGFPRCQELSGFAFTTYIIHGNVLQNRCKTPERTADKVTFPHHLQCILLYVKCCNLFNLRGSFLIFVLPVLIGITFSVICLCFSLKMTLTPGNCCRFFIL